MKTHRYILIALMLAFPFLKCGDQPIFDLLEDSNVSVILMGTYESNDPRSWIAYSDSLNDDSMVIVPPNYAVTNNGNVSSDHYLDASSYNSLPTKFNIDIAEMKINGDDFAPFRCVYKCDINEGASTDTDPFFNGTGVSFTNKNAIRGRNYDELNVYVRKIVMNNARKFTTSTGNYAGDISTIFYERSTSGYDVNPIQSIAIWDTLRDEMETTNRVFPLTIPISGGVAFDGESQYVLETRIVFKNYIRRYERLYNAGDKYEAYHFWGLSDWCREVRANDTYIGGNLLGVARCYIKGKTATISGTAPAGSYVIGILSSDNINSYVIADAIARPDDNYIAIAPKLHGEDINAYLDYYVSNQKYRDFFASYVTNVNKADTDLTSFHNAWTDHENSRKNLKIPPLATWTNSGSYKLTNVPPGTYTLYYSTTAVSAGSLPKDFSTGVTVTVLDSQIGTTIPQNL